MKHADLKCTVGWVLKNTYTYVIITLVRYRTFPSPQEIPLITQWFDFYHHKLVLPAPKWHPAPVLLPGKSHGRRSLVGCSPWDHWGSDTTEWLHFHFSLSCVGEGNGNPLQCSCLENPRDGGAWWAAVYGVAQSRTRLKRLSSSSSSSNITTVRFIYYVHGYRVWTATESDYSLVDKHWAVYSPSGTHNVKGNTFTFCDAGGQKCP